MFFYSTPSTFNSATDEPSKIILENDTWLDSSESAVMKYVIENAKLFYRFEISAKDKAFSIKVWVGHGENDTSSTMNETAIQLFDKWNYNRFYPGMKHYLSRNESSENYLEYITTYDDLSRDTIKLFWKNVDQILNDVFENEVGYDESKYYLTTIKDSFYCHEKIKSAMTKAREIYPQYAPRKTSINHTSYPCSNRALSFLNNCKQYTMISRASGCGKSELIKKILNSLQYANNTSNSSKKNVVLYINFFTDTKKTLDYFIEDPVRKLFSQLSSLNILTKQEEHSFAEISSNNSLEKLEFLLALISQKKQVNCYVIIDEFDRPFYSAYTRENGYDDVVKEMREFFSLLKQMGDTIRKTLMFGVVPIADEHIFKGIDVSYDNMMLTENPEEIGFSEKRAIKWIKKHRNHPEEKLKEQLKIAHLSSFIDKPIYSARVITANKEHLPVSSVNLKLAAHFISLANSTVREKILILCNRKSDFVEVSTNYPPYIDFSELNPFSLWIMLTSIGILNVQNIENIGQLKKYHFTIPNPSVATSLLEVIEKEKDELQNWSAVGKMCQEIAEKASLSCVEETKQPLLIPLKEESDIDLSLFNKFIEVVLKPQNNENIIRHISEMKQQLSLQELSKWVPSLFERLPKGVYPILFLHFNEEIHKHLCNQFFDDFSSPNKYWIDISVTALEKTLNNPFLKLMGIYSSKKEVDELYDSVVKATASLPIKEILTKYIETSPHTTFLQTINRLETVYPQKSQEEFEQIVQSAIENANIDEKTFLYQVLESEYSILGNDEDNTPSKWHSFVWEKTCLKHENIRNKISSKLANKFQEKLFSSKAPVDQIIENLRINKPNLCTKLFINSARNICIKGISEENLNERHLQFNKMCQNFKQAGCDLDALLKNDHVRVAQHYRQGWWKEWLQI